MDLYGAAVNVMVMSSKEIRLVSLTECPGMLKHLGPVYTGPDKLLHGQKLARFHLAFTRDWRNWTNIRTAKCASLGHEKSRSQTCTLSRSKIRPVPPVPCKRKVEPCKFLSVQKFVRTRVNGALETL